MTTVFTWVVEQLDAHGSNPVNVTAHWRCNGTDGTHAGGVYGTVGFEAPGGTFNPQPNMTKEQVLALVWQTVNQQATEAAVQAEIDAKATQTNGVFVPSEDTFEPLSPAEKLKAQIVEATQARLDDFARTRNYDGILSACTYADSTVPTFQAEGQYCVSARDQTWATLYQIMAEVEAGTRPMPSGYADIEGDLPVLTWPV